MLRRVAFVRTDVSEEHTVSIIRATSQKTFFVVTAMKTPDLPQSYRSYLSVEKSRIAFQITNDIESRSETALIRNWHAA
jgi:hypothetical protein